MSQDNSDLSSILKELKENLVLNNQFLKRIDNRLSSIDDKLTDVCHSITNSSSKQCTTAHLCNVLDDLKSSIDLLRNNEVTRPKPNVFVPNQSANPNLSRQESQNDVDKVRTKLNHIWKANLNERSKGYWNALRNSKISDIYENWSKEDNPILPNKFKIKEIRGEPKEQTKIRIDSSREQLKTEAILMKMRAKEHKEKYETKDKQMKDAILKLTHGKSAETLFEEWERRVKFEEEKSLNLWNAKQIWFINYEKREKMSIGNSKKIVPSKTRPNNDHTNDQKSYGKDSFLDRGLSGNPGNVFSRLQPQPQRYYWLKQKIKN